MLADFYNGKRVFVTGYTGFKGSWLAMWLTSLGAEVQGYALEPDSVDSMHRLCGLDKKIQGRYADIRDKEKLSSTLLEFQPDIVFHLAAQPLVSESYLNPVDTFEINIMGTVNLLEVVRNCSSVKAVVNVTTDKCYENTESLWGYRENDRLGGNDPYSCSKACSELVTVAYMSSFFNNKESVNISIATARAGNVIGGGDFAANRICPDIAKSILNSQNIELRNPLSVRPWQHVLDSLFGYLLLGKMLFEQGRKYEGSWNFGPSEENEINVMTLTQYMVTDWGTTSEIIVKNEEGFKETKILRLDSYKSRKILGFRSPWNIKEVISATVEWYKAYGESTSDLYQLSLEQINQYMKKLAIER